jgi:dipeptidyl aminopeptidase/acylaminoacyl peptidase
MTVAPEFWVGKDEHNGIPSLERPDAPRSRWSWEAIFTTPHPYNPVLSPDGTQIAYSLAPDDSDIWVVPVAGGEATRITTNRAPMPYWEDTPAAWSPDASQIAYATGGWIWLVPVAGGQARRLVEAYSPRWLDDSRLIVGVERDDEDRIALIDIGDPWPTPLTPPDQNNGGWTVGSDGSVLYVNYPDEDWIASHIWRVVPGQEPVQLTDPSETRERGPALSPDGAILAFISEQSGWSEVHLRDMKTGERRQLTHDDADFISPKWNSDGTRLVAVRGRRGRFDLVTIGPEDGSVTVLAMGGDWGEASWADDSIIALHEDHRTPPRLVRVDPDGSVTRLSPPPPVEISGGPVRGLEDVSFNSFDGLEIHGFLYRPDDTVSPVPAVVYAHGGPTSPYTDSWDPVAQHFVDKGYAWLAVNFRGCTSYGRDFERGNYGSWGVDDTKDCLAAYDFLAGLGWVDPKRVAVFGPSYGSYLALASLAHDPDHRYACGVAKYGDSEIATSWATGDRAGREYQEMMMKSPTLAPEAYRAGSPLWSASNIEKPILVVHGEQDERVPPAQSQQLVDELRRLEKRFEYVTYPTEAHGLLREGPFLHFHRRLERFLDWHLM